MAGHDSVPCSLGRLEFFPCTRLVCYYNAELRSSLIVGNLDCFEFKVSGKLSSTDSSERKQNTIH